MNDTTTLSTAVHDGGGFALRFDVRTDHLAHYAKQVVGSRHHEEHWIPSEEARSLR